MPFDMILPYRPRTNLERQRDFCARNPGYYARLKAKRRAKVNFEPWIKLNAEQLNLSSLTTTTSTESVAPTPEPAPAAPTGC